MRSIDTTRDQSMRRAAACSRLERRSRACYGVACAVLVGVALGVALYRFALPCLGASLC